VIAGGTEYKRLDLPGEDDLIGNGLSFCALCDGPSFTGKPVAVVGAGDGGLSQALHLLQFTDQVTLIEKLPHPTASPALLEHTRSDPRVSFMLSTTIYGVKRVDEGILLNLEEVAAKRRTEKMVGGAILSMGLLPNTGYLKGTPLLDEKEGWIRADLEMKTNIPGVFTAGDIRTGSPRQAIAAAADGVTSVISAFRFLKGG
jgi:thioredoxin reductase (NADPH)